MELQLLRKTISDVLQRECGLDAVHKHADAGASFDASVRTLAGELGWASICIPSDLGGLDLGVAALAVLGEEAGRTLAPDCLTTMALTASVLAKFAPSELRDRHLHRVLSGDLAVAIDAALCSHEPKDDRLLLGQPDAQLALLAIKGRDGATELGVADLTGGVGRLQPVNSWDRTRGLSTLDMKGIQVASLGVEAFDYACQAMGILIAADSLGAWQTVMEKTIQYLCVREQFGRKLGSFQALKHRLADLHVDHRLCQALLAFVGEGVTQDGVDALAWALVCKAQATDGASFAAGECLQLHGGIGFTWEHECHLFLKRTRLNQALIADNDTIRSVTGRRLIAGLAGDPVQSEPAHAAC